MKDKKDVAQLTDELTKEDKFDPTSKMILWLITSIDIKSGNKTKIAKICKTARQTWYDWLEVEGFEDWYYDEYDKRVRSWKPAVDRLGWKFAERGSDKHFEYLAKRTGNIKEDGGMSVNIDNRQVHVVALPERENKEIVEIDGGGR